MLSSISTSHSQEMICSSFIEFEISSSLCCRMMVWNSSLRMAWEFVKLQIMGSTLAHSESETLETGPVIPNDSDACKSLRSTVVSESVGLGWGLRICMCTETYLVDAASALTV